MVAKTHGNTKHGLRRTLEYGIWANIKSRCTNPNDQAFEYYGGRGIKICDRWLRFENFLEDMGKRPSSKSTLDRKDNNGDYEKSNCRWITMKEQCNNRRSNRILSFNGKSQNISQWAKELNIQAALISLRLGRGWSVEEALSKPGKPYDRVKRHSIS